MFPLAPANENDKNLELLQQYPCTLKTCLENDGHSEAEDDYHLVISSLGVLGGGHVVEVDQVEEGAQGEQQQQAHLDEPENGEQQRSVVFILDGRQATWWN